MKKILFITLSTPGNYGGGEVYTCELLKELSSFCKIDLVYFRYSDKPSYQRCNENVTVLHEQIIDKKFKILGAIKKFPLFPFFSARYSTKVSAIIHERMKQVDYDALYFDFSQTFSYVKDLNHPCKIMMCHDVIAQRYMRRHSRLSYWVKKSEKELLTYGDKIFSLSDKDCKLLKDLYDIESTPTTLFLSENVLKTVPSQIGDYFVMFGVWGRPENYNTLQWMIDEVLPKLPSQPHIKILGGGKMPDSLLNQLNSFPNLEYVGFVENPYPIISNAKAEIVPLRLGAGVKVKCVEALACGTPVIGTDVAFEGIPVLNGMEEFMVNVNTAEDVISAMQKPTLSLEKRLIAKRVFCNGYNEKNVVKFIRNL